MARKALTLLSKSLRVLGFLAAILALLILTGWAALMLHYSNLPWGWLRNAAAVAFVLFALAVFVLAARLRRPRWQAALVFLLAWFSLVIWFRLIPPSQSREWQRDVANPPRATIVGDTVTIENVRNFLYRSETDFDERWETRTFDLSKLDGHDLMFVYWGSPAIAHTMISFRFRDDAAEGGYSFLPISIEVRKEKPESYSTIAGFFRQFELYYVIADERDVVGLRTNHRGEDVYIMRTQSTPDRSRQILLDYLQGANELSRQAKWYNALTDNCTNGIVYHVRAIGDTVPITYELVFSGYADRYVYRAGGFDQSLPFDELKARSRINDAAAGNDLDPAFSAIIRRGLPGYAAPAGPN